MSISKLYFFTNGMGEYTCHKSKFVTSLDILQSTNIVFSNGLGKLGVWSYGFC